MKPKNKQTKIIQKARDGFNTDLLKSNYVEIHGDDDHLERILERIHVVPDGHYLDLGTGNGYIAFELSGRYPDIHVIGIDIADEAIRRNTARVKQERLPNIEFVVYDGIQLPFKDIKLDGVFSRYAIHHFPDLGHMIQQLAELLKPGGFIFLSDPTPNENDSNGFADQYMKLKDDGHLKLYRLQPIS